MKLIRYHIWRSWDNYKSEDSRGFLNFVPMLILYAVIFQNMGLRQEVELLKKENHILREKLSKYADV